MPLPACLSLILLLKSSWAVVVTKCSGTPPCGHSGFQVELFTNAEGTLVPRDLPYREPTSHFTVSQLCLAGSLAFGTLAGCPTAVSVCAQGDEASCSQQSFCEAFSLLADCTDLAFRFTANFTIAAAGTYTFRLASSDGSHLKIQNLAASVPALLENDGSRKGHRFARRRLDPATYPMELTFFFRSAQAGGLRLDYLGPDTYNTWRLLGPMAVKPIKPHRAPRLTLAGDDLVYVLQGRAWHEPGYVCLDTADRQIPTRFLPPNTRQPGSSSVLYKCEDSWHYEATATRTVVVRGGPVARLLGDASMSVQLGQPFRDPGACCSDFQGAQLKVTVEGTVNEKVAARYGLTYTCTDEKLNMHATVTRTVTVDQPPSLTLIGSARQRVIKRATYADPGMQCQDTEDGEINWADSGEVEGLAVVEITSSTGIPQHSCNGCFNTVGTAGSVGWVRFDLGDVRTVHALAWTGSLPAVRVRVGSNPVAPDWTAPVCFSSTSKPGNITCRSPLAGRYVMLEAILSPASLVICHVEILGSSGPGPPRHFRIASSGCQEGLGVEGSFSLGGVGGELPVYLGRAGSTLSHSGDRWILRSATHEVASLSSSGPLLSSGWELPAALPGCVLRLESQILDSCSWLFGHASNGHFRCADGHECPCSLMGCTSLDHCCIDTCCDGHGGVSMCPEERPQLCHSEWLCARDCSTRGGLRSCRSRKGGECAGRCSAKVETTGLVDTSQPGMQTLVLACIDSLGQRESLSRTVEVACEGPNPDGLYGGNKIQCEQTEQTLSFTNVEGCAQACLVSKTCEAYEFEIEQCQLKILCDKRYERDENPDRKVGYCLSKDHPPQVRFNAGPCCITVGDTYTDPGATCYDLEDVQPWPAQATTSNIMSTLPGNYEIQYRCEDSVGHVVTRNRPVTVKAACTVPTGVQFAAAAGLCAEGSLTVRHGERCTLQCAGGYAPSVPHLTCTSSSDLDTMTSLEPPFTCIPSPCRAPDVADVKGGTNGPQSCQEGYSIPSGSSCTPNCLGDGWPGFVPTVTSLVCVQGVLTPSDFRCRKPAASPTYVLARPSFISAELSWARGAASPDCSNWRFEVQSMKASGEGTGWGVILGCPRSRRAKSCTASDLLEGHAYVFRVREACDDAGMSGPWGTTVSVTTNTVPTPEVLFVMPSGDVENDPGQLMAVFSQSCATTNNRDSWVTVTQTGEHCNGQTFRHRASKIVTGSLAESGIQLAGERILIISTDLGFFQQGCVINVTLPHGVVQSLQQPAKASTEHSWSFTFLDRPPQVEMFAGLARSSRAGQFRIRWSEPTVFNCTASPKDIEACIKKAVWEVEGPNAADLCSPRKSNNIRQLSAAAHVEFQVDQLYPGVEYQVQCAGHKLGKPWIPTLPDPVASVGPMTYITAEDTSASISTLDLNVFVVCNNGQTALRRSESIQQSDVASGYVAQILDWKVFCNRGAHLKPGERARLRIDASTSQRSRVKWLAGPVMDISYVAPPPDEQSVVKKTFVLKICPLQSNPCQRYELEVRAVDVLFNFRSEGFIVKDNETRQLGKRHHLVRMGAAGELPATSSDPSFDWSEVGIFLGDQRDGFQLPTSYSEGRLHFHFFGQGTSLPLWLAWQGAMFHMELSISFMPPTISFHAVNASILTLTELEVTISNVPNCTELLLRTPRVDIQGGYANPSEYINLLVVKKGQPVDENLCSGGTYFKPGRCWSVATCLLAPAALANIGVLPLVLDAESRKFKMAANSTALPGVSYQVPSLTGLEEASGPSSGGPINLGNLVNGSQSDLILTGASFPTTSSLMLQGARFDGYRLKVMGMDGNPVNLCSSIQALDSQRLQCKLVPCIFTAKLPNSLEVRLYLGDLVSVESVRDQLVLPRPEVLSFGPPEVGDTGPGRFLWFRGRHFMETSCQPDMPNSQLIGPPSGLEITVGITRRPCHLVTQNDSYCRCEVRDYLMEVSVASYVMDWEPQVQRSMTERIDISANGRLAALNVDADSGLLPLELRVVLRGCPTGERRKQESTASGCTPCPRGRWSTASSNRWPLYCESCPPGKYQDEVGASVCKDCPVNTVTRGNAITRTDCLCKPGYYSQQRNDTTDEAISGIPCVECHSSFLTESPLPAECASSDPIVELCDVQDLATCVRDGLGILRICKAYCPGGTTWPKAKRDFWHGGNALVGAGLEPQFLRCDPADACQGGNECAAGYKGERCDTCRFGYWRDVATNACMPCGSEQGVGELLLVAAIALMIFGGLATMSAYMRVQADLQFAQEVFTLVEMYFVQPLKSSTLLMRLFGRAEKREVVMVHHSDVGRSLNYARDKNLGMVFRVDDQRVVHLAGLSLTSPMKWKVEVGWKLQTVNGQRLSSKTEEEVQAYLKDSPLPMRLTFSAPQKWIMRGKDVEEEEEPDLDLSQDRKMLIVMLGVLNSFTQISNLNFKWPPIVTRLAELAKKLTFNLNFFRPECSIETSFLEKWIYFLLVPYFTVIPLLVACGVACFLTLSHQRGEAFSTKSWLLMNAFARCCCLAFIFLLPFHLDQLLVPFACLQSNTNTTFVSAMPDTECSLNDPIYLYMVQVSVGGLLVVLAFFSMLLLCLRMSFQWQGGEACVRDFIPFYVAIVEVSTFGQRGYVAAVRDRVFHNIFATRSFEPEAWKVERRQLLAHAVVELGHRSRHRKRAAREAMLFGSEGTPLKSSMGEEEAESRNDVMEQQVRTLHGKQRFERVTRWPTRPDGNMMTYGWVLIVNLFWRQLATLCILKLTTGRPVVIGAAFQMLVFASNAVMLICFHPYQSDAVTRTEGVLLTSLLMLLWCAVLKDLLENHTEARRFTGAISTFSSFMEVLAVLLVGVVVLLPLYQLASAGKKILDLTLGPDAMLNKIYMRQYVRRERERKVEELNNLREFIDLGDKDEDAVKTLTAKLPQLDEALSRLRDLGLDKDVDQQEQRRILVRMAKIVRRIEEDMQKQRELQMAVEESKLD